MEIILRRGEKELSMKSSFGGLRLTLLVAFGVVFAAVASGQTFTEFALPTANSGPFGIAAGPDDALWFNERVSNKIGRITTKGAITAFAIPTSNNQPTSIHA